MNSLVVPEKKQPQGILCKLFSQLTKGKDVQSLLLTGYGRVSADDELSLSHFITLLKYLVLARDGLWEAEMQTFLDHFCNKLVPQGIEAE